MKGLSEQTRLALLANILDTVTDAIVAIDESQCILLFNRGAEQVFGYRAEEVLGGPLDLLLPPGSVEAHRARVPSFVVAPGDAWDTATRREMRGRRKNGSEFPAEASISRFTEGCQTILTVVLRDITRRKQAQEALRESEERYRSIVSAMSEGVVLQNADGSIVACNEAAERILGLTHDQMMGRTSIDPRWRAVHEDVSPFSGEDHPAMITLRTGQSQSRVVMGVHKPDGTLNWISINSEPLFHPGETAPYAVVTSFEDITEKWQAERALRASEERYRSLFDNSLDGILLTAPDGGILAANAAACRILGRTEEEICRIGRNGLLDRTDPYLGAALEERARQGKFRGELFFLHRDGTRFPCDVSSSVFRDKDGQLKTSTIIRDITERVQAYQLLEQRVQERTRELSALLDVSRNVASMLELGPLLRLVLTQLRTVLEYTGAAIGIVENGEDSPQGAEVRLVEYEGPLPREMLLQQRYPLDSDTGYHRVVVGRAPVIISDIWADTPWLRALQTQTDEEIRTAFAPVRSWMGVPLLVRDQVIGVLRVDHTEPDHFTDTHARLALAFADHAAVAIENARAFEQAGRLAALEERQHLARELHDSISQALFAIALSARTARAQLARNPSKVAEPLDYLLSLAEAAFADMRALIFELRPEALETQGLVEALAQQVEVLRTRYRIKVEARFGPEPAVPSEIKQALYRVVQEALNNIIKYARASEVQLSLIHSGPGLILEVKDNGIGFDPVAPLSGHMGLRSMRERAERLGGTFELESRPGAGTYIRVQIPVPG